MMTDGKRPLPPYGAQCLKMILNHHRLPSVWGRSPDGSNLTVSIGAGADCWSWAQQWQGNNRPLAILPFTDSPYDYDWSFCIGCDPVVIQSIGRVHRQQVHELGHELLLTGIQRVIHLGGARYLPREIAA